MRNGIHKKKIHNLSSMKNDIHKKKYIYIFTFIIF